MAHHGDAASNLAPGPSPSVARTTPDDPARGGRIRQRGRKAPDTATTPPAQHQHQLRNAETMPHARPQDLTELPPVRPARTGIQIWETAQQVAGRVSTIRCHPRHPAMPHVARRQGASLRLSTTLVTSGSALASTCYSKAASGRRRPWVDILIHARPALFKPARRQLARPAVLLDAKALVGVDRRSRLCWCSPRGPDQRSACGRQDDVAKTPRTPIKPVTNPRATAGSKGILVHYSTLRALPGPKIRRPRGRWQRLGGAGFPRDGGGVRLW
jgi:hypothetical protein